MKYLKKVFYKKKNEGFDLLFAGDFSFGENYQEVRKNNGQESILDKYGYDYCLKKLKPLMIRSDFVAVNLETPITDLKKSPFEGDKPYVHWTDTEKSPKALVDHNVSLISLANNHSFDYGIEGYNQTLNILKKNKLPVIGAGKDIYEAAKPFICEVNFGNKKLNIAIISSFEEGFSYREKYKVYAEINKPGLMPLKIEFIENQVREIKKQDPNTLVIFFPHWGKNYKWCNDQQKKMAKNLFSVGIDLIVGHGAHMMQEFEKIDQKLCLYNIGNFMFSSPGRYSKMEVPPYSATVSLNAKLVNGKFDISLNLYPIITDNKITNYQPRFLNKKELYDFYKNLKQRKIMQECEYFLQPKKDKVGYHFSLPIKYRQKISSSKLLVSKIQEEKWIGMIYHEKYDGRMTNGRFNLVMDRASILSPALAKDDYRLICYSPKNVDKEKNMISGYVWKGDKFQATIAPMPKIHHDCYIGPDNFGYYRDLQSCADKKNYKIYPNRGIKKLSRDKLYAAKIISDFDKSIIPFTQLFDGTSSQIEKYLESRSIVFIKPRFGSMGNSIFVVKRDNDKFILEYYLEKEKTSESFVELNKCLDHIKNSMNNKEYIIQEAIDVVRFDKSVFDVRALVFNESGDWRFATETRISKESSEVSNGGYNEVSIETLERIYSKDKAARMFEKIKNTAINLVSFLSNHSNTLINELGFDIIIDKSDKIYIAEVNWKSGTAGPAEYSDFFNMTKDEKYLYENLSVKHGECLAKSLISRDKEMSSEGEMESMFREFYNRF